MGGVRWNRISTLPRQSGQEGEEVASMAIAVGKEDRLNMASPN